MRDKILRRYLGIDDDEGYFRKRENGLLEKIGEILDTFVINYFKDCPCCENTACWIFKETVYKFKKLEGNEYGGNYIVNNYTDKSGYEIHKKQIQKWEKEVEIFNKKNNK